MRMVEAKVLRKRMEKSNRQRPNFDNQAANITLVAGVAVSVAQRKVVSSSRAVIVLIQCIRSDRGGPSNLEDAVYAWA